MRNPDWMTENELKDEKKRLEETLATGNATVENAEHLIKIRRNLQTIQKARNPMEGLE